MGDIGAVRGERDGPDVSRRDTNGVLIVKLWAKAEATKTRGTNAAFIVEGRGVEQKGMVMGRKAGVK